jgi:uncharacterized protein with von Willebrand factor type A (vWA) domain
MNVNEPPLLELFTRLSQAGLPLGLEEYKLLLHALQSGFGISDRAALARLCCTLWIKSVEEKRIFDYHFEQVMAKDIALFKTSASSTSKISISENSQEKKDWTRWRKLVQLKHYMVLGGAFLLGFSIFIGFAYVFGKNYPPKFVSLPVEETKVGEEYIYPIKAWDMNRGNTLTITAPIKPSWLTLTDHGEGKATLSGKKPNGQDYKVELLVFDNHGARDTQAFIVKNYTTSDQRRLILILLLSLVALIAGYLLFNWMIKLITKRRTTDNLSLPKAIRSRSSALELKPKDISNTVQKATRRKIQSNCNGFTETNEYFSITRRQMKQSWRYLRQIVREGSPTELDIEATINQIGRQGLLLDPVLVPRRVNRTQLLLIIDQDGSMSPFHDLSNYLAEAALRGGRLGKANIYYFHNCPIEYLYYDPNHLTFESIDDILAHLQFKYVAVLFVSDAGAARGGFNPERIKLTAKFLEKIKQRIRYIAWLNPIPRSRWTGTTAGEIARLVPMFELNRKGLDNAISVLRGKSTPHKG